MLVRHLPRSSYTHKIGRCNREFSTRIKEILNLTLPIDLFNFVHFKRLFFLNDNFKIFPHLLTSCVNHFVMLALTINDYLMQIVILIITSNLSEELDPNFARWLLNHFQKITHKDRYHLSWLGHAMCRGLVKWLILLIGSK